MSDSRLESKKTERQKTLSLTHKCIKYLFADTSKNFVPQQQPGDGIIDWAGIPIAQGDGIGHVHVFGRMFSFWKTDSNMELLDASRVADKHYSGIAQFFVGERGIMITDAHLYHQLFSNPATENLLERQIAIEANFAVASGNNNTFTSLRLDKNGAVNKEWSSLKKILANKIHSENLKDKKLPHSIDVITKQVMSHLEDELKESKGVLADLESFCIKITMSVTAKVFMGVPLDDKEFIKHVDEIADLYTELLKASMHQGNAMAWLLRPAKLSSCYKTNVEKAREKLQKKIQQVYLDPYLEFILSTDNVIRRIAALDPVNKGKKPEEFDLSSVFMTNQIILMLLLGHDTTARAIQFMLMHLADDKELQRKILEEIENCKPDNGLWTQTEILKMPVLNAVFKETERLYPGAPFLGYGVKGDLPIKTELLDLKLKKGSFVFYSLFTAQRSAKYFKNPEQFDHTRFMSDEKSDSFTLRSKPSSTTPFFSPLGFGKRHCPAEVFAPFEACVAVIHFLEKYEFKKQKPDAEIVLDMIGTLRPKDAVPMELMERELLCQQRLTSSR